MKAHPAHLANRQKLAKKMAAEIATIGKNPEYLSDSEWTQIAKNAGGKSVPSVSTRALVMEIAEAAEAAEAAPKYVDLDSYYVEEFCHSKMNQWGEVEYD